MAEKILNTRIALKYDTLANWTASTLILKAGEIAFAVIETANVAAGEHPPVMFKVGDGSKTFSQLSWGAATAADVYGWAKQDKIDVQQSGTGNVVASIAWDATANGGKGGLKYETASVATAEGMAGLQEALEALTEKVNGMYTNDQIDTAVAGAKTYADEQIAALSAEGGAIKTVADDLAELKGKVEDEDGALARANAAYELADAAQTAQEVQDALNTAKSEIIGTSGDAATADTIYGAKAAAQVAKDAADAAQLTIDTFLNSENANETVDTLKEIQAELDRLGEAVELETQFAAKADKVTGAVNGNFAGLDANGNLTDSGSKASDFDVAGAATAAQTAAEGKAQELVDALANGAVKTNTEAIAALNIVDGTVAKAEEATSVAANGVNTAAIADKAVTKAKLSQEIQDALQNAADFEEGITGGTIEAYQALQASCDSNGNDIAGTYATKKEVQALTTDDIAAGTEVWLFDCGNASTKLNEFPQA